MPAPAKLKARSIPLNLRNHKLLALLIIVGDQWSSLNERYSFPTWLEKWRLNSWQQTIGVLSFSVTSDVLLKNRTTMITDSKITS